MTDVQAVRRVDPVLGELTDHYDPRVKQVRLARDNFAGPSVAAMAVSAHECGHALQDADGYGPMKLKGALVPVANAGIDLVGEFLTGRRVNKDGQSGMAAQFQFGGRFRF